MKSPSAATAAVRAGNRFERRRSRTRRDLLDAATVVLAQKGLERTKISDIAAAADVGVGTFYLHFPTKTDLFHALVEETARELKETVDAARARARDPVESMLAANAAFCRFAQENRAVFKIVFGHATAYDDVIRQAQAGFAADIEQTVREGIDRRVFTPLPPAVVAQAVVGMATQMLSWWVEHEAVPIETLQETLTTMTLRALGAAAPEKGDSNG
jgi:AcrR family transcriptional regulator